MKQESEKYLPLAKEHIPIDVFKKEVYGLEPGDTEEDLEKARKEAFVDFQEIGWISNGIPYSADVIDEAMLHSSGIIEGIRESGYPIGIKSTKQSNT